MKNSRLFEEAPTGTILYSVRMHYYHVKQIPYCEYVVTREKVKAHIQLGYNEIRTSDGHTPHYYQAKDFGKNIFFTEEEASQEALRRTIASDQIWTKLGEPPMRRTWEKSEEKRSDNA